MNSLNTYQCSSARISAYLSKANFLLGMFLLFFCLHLSSQTSNPFYYYKSEKIYLVPNPSKILVVFNDTTQNNDIDLLRLLGLDIGIKVKKNQKDNLLKKGTVVWSELEISGQAEIATTNTLLSNLNQNVNVKRANPYFKTKNGQDLGLSHLFYVKLKSPSDYSKLTEVALLTQTEIGWQNEFMPLWYTLYATKKSKGNSLDMANYFFETGYFEIAQPSFVYDDPTSSDHKLLTTGNTASDTKQFAIDNLINCPTEPDFNLQWGLKNTGQNLNQLGNFANFSGIPGMDIKICEARDVTKGNPNIIIAVLDIPIQETHPDLSNNIVPGFNVDAGVPGNLTPIPTNHGTAVAGIIAALDNNLGVSGIAPNSKLMSLGRVSTMNFEQNTSNAIHWAVDNGVSVINNSWNTNTPDAMIDEAILYAVTQGRNGLGCVVAFSAGNIGGNSVGYPATNPNVIAVGGMTPCGKRPDEGLDCNNGTLTSYGIDLDIVAPGELIRTTDLTGSAGGNPGDFTSFGSSSGACPHVSGVAALILSVNPCLTQLEVRQIIESTAQKVNAGTPYVYSTNGAHPNGTWNIEMGHGLVDANAAVIEARTRLLQSVNKPNAVFSFAPQVITGNITFAANTVVLSHDDINILAGSTLTVNGTLIMARGKSIKVQQNGQLLVNGGTITALCGMWGGIQVWGNGQVNYSSTNRGNANLVNATIEYALDALVAHDPASPSNSFGGMVGAGNTIFRNNRQDININGWNFTGWFVLCTFEVNNSYRHNQIRTRVRLSNSSYSYSAFSGCTFINNYTGNVNILGDPYSNWVGIDCFGCGLYVEAGYDNGVQKKSSFERFYSGIHAFYLSTDNWIHIEKSDFRGNVEGIISEGVNNLYASYNNFFIGGTNPFPSSLWYRTGISLSYGTGYTIQRNTFLNNNAPYPFGTLVMDTGSEPNKIDFNSYGNVYVSNRVLGNNRDNSTGAGLQLRCNDNALNIYDNVVESGEGIATFQGTSSNSDGNLFSINGGAPDYYNDSNNPINRYYVPGTRTFASTGGITSISQISVLQNGCTNAPAFIMEQNNTMQFSRPTDVFQNNKAEPATSQMLSQLSLDLPTLSSEERNILASNFELKNEDLKSSTSKYKALIDDGNTAKMISDITNKWSKDALTLRKNLLLQSPNLSEDVLFEIAQLGILSQSALMEVLVANIGSSKNKLFLEKLMNNIPNPLSTQQIDILKSTPIPPSVRFDLEVKINSLKGDVMDIGRQLVSDIHKSRDKYPADSLRYWLAKLNSPEAYYALAETHIKEARSNDFGKSLKDLAKDFKEIEKNKEAHDTYVDLYSLKSKILKSGRDLKDITDDEAKQLRTIATGKKSKASVIANNILCYALGECRPMEVPKIKEELQVRNIYRQLSNSIESEETYLRAFPNPAKDVITLEYRLPEHVTTFDFVITNLTGIEITRVKINNSESKNFTWNTDNIESGIYMISIQNQGKQILSQKLSIIK